MPGFDDRAVGEVVAELASPGGSPAAGVATALTCAQAAALVELTAALAANRIASEDTDTEARLRELGRRARTSRERALAVAEAAAEVAEGGAEVAAAGEWPFTADAVVASKLAAAAAAGALELVAANLGAGDDPRLARARQAAERALRAAG